MTQAPVPKKVGLLGSGDKMIQVSEISYKWLATALSKFFSKSNLSVEGKTKKKKEKKEY